MGTDSISAQNVHEQYGPPIAEESWQNKRGHPAIKMYTKTRGLPSSQSRREVMCGEIAKSFSLRTYCAEARMIKIVHVG